MRSVLKILLIFVFIANVQAKTSFRIIVPQLKLECGDTLHEAPVFMEQFGKINADSSNIILFPTWFGGKTEHVQAILGPGRLIDTTRFAVLVMASPGNGQSLTPKSVMQVLNGDFPALTIADFIRLHYRAVQQLHLHHVKALVGGSMGGMQVLQWLVQYPHFMDQAVIYVATPYTTVSDRMRMSFLLQWIEYLVHLRRPPEEIYTFINGYMYPLARTPAYYNLHFTWQQMTEQLARFQQKPSLSIPLAGYVLDLKAMIQHDITHWSGKNLRHTAEMIKARCLFIISQHDQLVNPAPAKQLAAYLKAPLLILDNPCGHLAIGCDWPTVHARIEQFLTTGE